MAFTYLVWVDGDRDGRRDGEIYGVSPNDQPWTPQETGVNHRRCQTPGLATEDDYHFLEDNWRDAADDNLFLGRRRFRLSLADTTTVKAAAAASTTVIPQANLDNDLRDDASV